MLAVHADAMPNPKGGKRGVEDGEVSTQEVVESLQRAAATQAAAEVAAKRVEGGGRKRRRKNVPSAAMARKDIVLFMAKMAADPGRKRLSMKHGDIAVKFSYT